MDALRTRSWSSQAPTWREVGEGLCIHGRCRNKSCEAYKRKVICTMGFVDVDIAGPNKISSRCPMCKSRFTPKKPGFNNCWWKIEAVKTSSPECVFHSPWNRALNEYTTYDEATAGTSEFVRLKVSVRPLWDVDHRSGSSLRPICLEDVNGDYVTTSCKHVFHKCCWQEWKQKLASRDQAPTCPLCRQRDPSVR